MMLVLAIGAIAVGSVLGQFIAFRPLAPKPRPPKPAPIVRSALATVVTPRLWEPGSTAFWLDPDLWLRTPEVDGRPELCWMHLDDPILRARVRDLAYENQVNFGAVGGLWFGSHKAGRIGRRTYHLAAFQCEQVIRELLPRYSSAAIHEDALALMRGHPTARRYGSGTRLEALQAIASQLLDNRTGA